MRQRELLRISELSEYLEKNVKFQCDFKRPPLAETIHYYYRQCTDVDFEFKYCNIYDFQHFFRRTFLNDEFRKPLIKYQKDFEKTFGVTYKKYENCFGLNPKMFYPIKDILIEVTNICMGRTDEHLQDIVKFAFDLRFSDKNKTLYPRTETMLKAIGIITESDMLK